MNFQDCEKEVTNNGIFVLDSELTEDERWKLLHES